ncbi:uncharacterized protein LOC129583858 [Paramacrobiotus metropolitanus]|uniref:uncharacterized protein LOC129583858 n=1 Tax=Paramacrobiotus metropolitanus TaxID=2943436 RepID=UPI00244621BC|nr:uncharacterized protein LOC129583858 [Paramacrobiotus metropolitanus]
MARNSPSASFGAPSAASKSPTAAIATLQEAQFTKPLITLGNRLSEFNGNSLPPQSQAAQLCRILADVLPEIQQLKTNMTKWHQAIDDIPGIQRNTAQQMERLDNLNYAVTRRYELLQRHRNLVPDGLGERAGRSGNNAGKAWKPAPSMPKR